MGMVLAADWKSILDKIQKRMEQWGSQWIKITSRVVLLKVVLSSLSIYHNSILLSHPSKVPLKLGDSIRNTFGREEKGMIKNTI